ncbi:hypothetical protein D5086_020768 [Populus alba]|uniref:Uncharacterized protein n=1 Tax=Populus alba TaxID=43335 RepID=A0ACC4BMG6_POPAL
MKKKRRESSHQHSRVNTVDYFLERHLIGDTNDRSYDLRPPSQRQAEGTPPPWGSFRGLLEKIDIGSRDALPID